MLSIRFRNLLFLHQKLQQTFGQEATEYLVSWIESVDNNRADIAELPVRPVDGHDHS